MAQADSEARERNMTTQIYCIELTSDAVQPITIPSGAQFLYAVAYSGRAVEMYYLGDSENQAMEIIVSQVTDTDDILEASIRHIGSGHDVRHQSVFHIFEVLS